MSCVTAFCAPCRLRLAVKICVSESVTVIEFSITDLEKTITLTVLPVTDIENGPMQCFFTALGLNIISRPAFCPATNIGRTIPVFRILS